RAEIWIPKAVTIWRAPDASQTQNGPPYIRAGRFVASALREPSTCSNNRRGDSRAQERRLMSWAIDCHCRKSGGVRFLATAIRAAPESAGVIFVDESVLQRHGRSSL